MPCLTELDIFDIMGHDESQQLPPLRTLKSFEVIVPNPYSEPPDDINLFKDYLQFTQRIPTLFPALEQLTICCELKHLVSPLQEEVQKLQLSLQKCTIY